MENKWEITVREKNYQMLTLVPLLLSLILIRHKGFSSAVGNASNPICSCPERLYVPHSQCEVLTKSTQEGMTVFLTNSDDSVAWNRKWIAITWLHPAVLSLWILDFVWKSRLCWEGKVSHTVWQEGTLHTLLPWVWNWHCESTPGMKDTIFLIHHFSFSTDLNMMS